ncbi:uncharacterized protein LOC114291911 isoform X1 [Camellia sinensis]|uniref:uncharacterized protein LOC114291911 isoform X1 n=1 Tax=Camellia sinensis TaxID=4442 RepID=UPI001035C620|nr:uncharacterized protein LOC114291911 isoform X1 [Camellia sinensis]
MGQTNGTMSSVTGIPSTGVHEVSVLPSRVSHETCAPASEADSAKDWVVAGPAEVSSELIPSKFAQGSSSKLDRRLGESGTSDTLEMLRDDFYIETGREMDGEEEFLEVKVDFQVIWLITLFMTFDVTLQNFAAEICSPLARICLVYLLHLFVHLCLMSV